MTFDTLSPALAALADPTRRAIVQQLTRGEATVSELTAPLAISMPAVSRHLKVLERAGLVERGRDAQFRPCRLRPEGLREVGSFVSELQQAWEQRLDRLETYLADLQAAEAASASPTHPTRGTPRHGHE